MTIRKSADIAGGNVLRADVRQVLLEALQMLCQKCGVRRAQTIVTSCDGVQCYELHLCLQCQKGISGFPTPDEQKKVVEPAMADAEAKGFDTESISNGLGIEAEEIRRVLRGEGVSDPAVWEVIKKHLRTD